MIGCTTRTLDVWSSDEETTLARHPPMPTCTSVIGREWLELLYTCTTHTLHVWSNDEETTRARHPPMPTCTSVIRREWLKSLYTCTTHTLHVWSNDEETTRARHPPMPTCTSVIGREWLDHTWWGFTWFPWLLSEPSAITLKRSHQKHAYQVYVYNYLKRQKMPKSVKMLTSKGHG